MAYIGNTLRTAQPNYQIIDDISASFDGSTTSFALQVGGVTPAPFPVNAQHCLISVGGVVQQPDPSGTDGFLLSGSNIVFSAAPSFGEDFFGVVLAGADYINVGANFPDGSVATPSITFDQDTDTGLYRKGANNIAITTNGTERVSVGTSEVVFNDGGNDIDFRVEGNTEPNLIFVDAGNDTVSFRDDVTIDSSGRLLVGTSSSVSTNCFFQSLGNPANDAGTEIYLGRNQPATTPLTAGQSLGDIRFGDNAGNVFANIAAQVDNTSGSGDHPGRLVFSTTADGASSPTERMRIKSNGDILLGKLTSDNDETGVAWKNPTSTAAFLNVTNNSTSSAARVMAVNRQASDGRLIELRQADSMEGVISVSGTSVTYGGGNLARWSQLINNEDPSNILRGTVLSNLDEMCEWEGEDNEQLNKTKVSDVEGDPNVAGVFISTSFDEVGPLDFFVGMTGDFIIRIAEGVTVERGDLLMSAGDGTAKPQDDDIIRSKTIAKVTSTNVSCTYDDGSYCVPCVLMAC